MKATQLLHDLGQSLWLDNITRDLLDGGTLKRYIDELSVTGLTSNPTIFDHAIKNSTAYDAAIRKKLEEGKSGEELFFELALEDLTRAADLFGPSTTAPTAWTAGYRWRFPPSGPRHGQHSRCGQESARPSGASQSINQNSGDQRRSPRDRRGDLRRRADQRYTLVFPRALHRGGRGFFARRRAAH